jgi:hypothetical protein
VPGRDDSCSVQPSPASCATCRGTWVVPRALALTHRHPHKSPCVRRPFAEISGSISYPPPWFPSYFCVSLQGFTPFWPSVPVWQSVAELDGASFHFSAANAPCSRPIVGKDACELLWAVPLPVQLLYAAPWRFLHCSGSRRSTSRSRTTPSCQRSRRHNASATSTPLNTFAGNRGPRTSSRLSHWPRF